MFFNELLYDIVRVIIADKLCLYDYPSVKIYLYIYSYRLVYLYVLYDDMHNVRSSHSGGMLHLHDLSMTSTEWLIEFATYRTDCYMCVTASTNHTLFCIRNRAPVDTEGQWLTFIVDLYCCHTRWCMCTATISLVVAYRSYL